MAPVCLDAVHASFQDSVREGLSALDNSNRLAVLQQPDLRHFRDFRVKREAFASWNLASHDHLGIGAMGGKAKAARRP
jgi:hypothetical protein